MLCEHDPAKDQLSPVSVEGSDRHGIENCKYCLLIMRTAIYNLYLRRP
jgi:hypothetical protein